MENFILNDGFFDASIIKVPEDKPAASSYAGSNHKKLLIVSMMEDSNKTSDIEFLKKIFGSVKVDLEEDTSLLQLTQNTIFSWDSIAKSGKFEQVIFFGTSPKNIGLQFNFEWYKLLTFQQKRFLFAESLGVIATDRSKKGALWNALKEMFEQ